MQQVILGMETIESIAPHTRQENDDDLVVKEVASLDLPNFKI